MNSDTTNTYWHKGRYEDVKVRSNDYVFEIIVVSSEFKFWCYAVALLVGFSILKWHWFFIFILSVQVLQLLRHKKITFEKQNGRISKLFYCLGLSFYTYYDIEFSSLEKLQIKDKEYGGDETFVNKEFSLTISSGKEIILFEISKKTDTSVLEENLKALIKSFTRTEEAEILSA